MVFALILFLAVIIFLAFFIGKNLSNVCTFWLFKTFTDLPVVILVFVSFAAGIVFSILIQAIVKIRKRKSLNTVSE